MRRFRLNHEKPFEELPREVQLAQVLRVRGVKVDRLHMTITVPFEPTALDPYECRALAELKNDYHFLQLPWEPSV